MNKICAIVVGMIAITALSGCNQPTAKTKPPRKEAAEFDCRKHDKDKICIVPWKDKTVLYCYKGAIPRVVRYREECK